MAVCDVSVYFVIVRRKATNMRWFLILLVWRRLYPCRPYLAFVSVCLSCADCTHVVRAFSVYRATYEDSSKKPHVSAACMRRILVTQAKMCGGVLCVCCQVLQSLRSSRQTRLLTRSFVQCSSVIFVIHLHGRQKPQCASLTLLCVISLFVLFAFFSDYKDALA